VEYANTVNDLFGPAYAKIAEELDPGDAAFEGFRNDIAVTIVDSKTFEQLRSVAAKISTALPAADLEPRRGEPHAVRVHLEADG
jgi:hypothetical protein